MNSSMTKMLDCYVYIGKTLVIKTKCHPEYGPLTQHKISKLAVEAQKKGKR